MITIKKGPRAFFYLAEVPQEQLGPHKQMLQEQFGLCAADAFTVFMMFVFVCY